MHALRLILRIFAVIEIVGTVLWGSFIFLMSGMDHSADLGRHIELGALACYAFALLGCVLLMLAAGKKRRLLETCLVLWCAIPAIFVILASDNREWPHGWGI